jgi:hypothetical protein
VRQVLVNLLGNAVKFTEPGGTVEVLADTVAVAPPGAGLLSSKGPWTFVRVRDTGVGITPEEQARVFEPFHQVEGGHTRRVGGTGLGLAISRRLARLMGGELVVESTPGVGSVFTLWLPAPGEGVARGDTGELAAVRLAAGDGSAAPAVSIASMDRIGVQLRVALDAVLDAYVDRMRSDPELPRARQMRRSGLEDHALSLLADLAQSLVIVADVNAEVAGPLRDSSAIQRAIAEAHGARRHAQGWSEANLRRDHQLLREEVERAVRARLPAGIEVDLAAGVLLEMLDRVGSISLRAWRRAASAEAGR